MPLGVGQVAGIRYAVHAAVLQLHRLFKQPLTYLRLSGKHLGLLINFNVVLIKDGISRVVNGLVE
ncbi:MAG TPA: GxxExxY protein [Gemmataceae bacterium]|nr:GxxExxY protein [Gemmataceae bacterium]